MKNDGFGPLHAPGFGGMPMDEELPVSDRFAHGFSEWEQVPAITRREFTMVQVMNDLTDDPSWHINVFDQDKVNRWHDEIIASTPLMSERAWDWCVAELRDKAVHYGSHGYVRVLDTGSLICKSDTLVSQEICVGFRCAFQSISAVRNDRQASNGILSLIDPSSYPLAWGKSLVLTQGGHVTRQGHIVGTQHHVTERAPAQADKRIRSESVQQKVETGSFLKSYEPWVDLFKQEDHDNIGSYFWSYKHQWLPTEVKFTKSKGVDVQLTSYINDLSLTESGLDKPLEKIISLSIEPWNACLMEGRPGWDEPLVRLPNGWAPPGNERAQRGRVPCRIITYGTEWEEQPPEWLPLFDTERRRRLQKYLSKQAEVLEAVKQEKPSKDADHKTQKIYRVRRKAALWELEKEDPWVAGIEPLPEPSPEDWIKAKEYLERPLPGSNVHVELPEGWERYAGISLRSKARQMLHHKHPEPGTAFSYDEWKSGTHGGKAIVNMITEKPVKLDRPNTAPLKTPHKPYTVCLQDRFRKQGLQVIIRAQDILLDPESPEYSGSAWEICGNKNEHIAAVAMVSYDVHNVTSSRISFRQQTNIGEAFFYRGPSLYQASGRCSPWKGPLYQHHKVGEVEAISDVFGFDPDQMHRDNYELALPLQDIGHIALSQGRLLTFPNTMEHRREPFQLQDPTKPGHHRSVTIMLVDPNYRICSTRNVPPQMADETRSGTAEAEQEGCFGTVERERYCKEMEKEHVWAMYARYRKMMWFFLDT